MKRWDAILVVGLAVAAAGFEVSADDGKQEVIKQFEGKWQIVKFEVAGKVLAEKGAPDRVVVNDGKATFFSQGKELPTMKNLALRLDPDDSRALDLVRDEDEVLPCYYELNGDQWKLAMPLIPTERKPDEPLPRPDSFKTKNVLAIVMLAKRIKE